MNKFFIIGCPRSGTTMLQQALNRHSQIVIPPETKFFYYLIGQSRRQQLRHIERLRHDLQIDLPIPRSRIATAAMAQNYYELMASLYCRQIQRTPSHFGEKTPEHTSRIPILRKTFPNAKLVFIYRDGRDVAQSLSKMPWLMCDLNVGVWIWQRYHRLMQEAMRDRDLDFHVIRYEDIVSHPQQQFSSLLRFLGLSDEPSVAQGCGNTEGIPARELAWKSMALKPIESSRRDVWKRELSKEQIRDMECIAGDSLRDIGYDVVTNLATRRNLPLQAKLAIGLLWCGLLLPAPCVINELRANIASALDRSRDQDVASVRLSDVIDLSCRHGRIVARHP